MQVHLCLKHYRKPVLRGSGQGTQTLAALIYAYVTQALEPGLTSIDAAILTSKSLAESWGALAGHMRRWSSKDC